MPIVTKQDNTRISGKHYPDIELTLEQQEYLKYKRLSEILDQNQAYLYDADKVKYYKNLQDFYNTNFFGYGVVGKQTNYNPADPDDQAKIESNFEYARQTVKNFYSTLIAEGVGNTLKGILPLVGRNRVIDKMSNLTPYKIGGGAEAVVIDNSPLSVGKITQISKGDMAARNLVPNTVPSRFVGYVEQGSNKFPTYTQRKVNILDENGFNKYVDKLDKAMSKKGFRQVKDPNVQYRAYTNGKIVVDDVSPGNVGLNIFKKPKLIDFNISSVPEWLEQGFTLKLGGKLQKLIYG